MGDQIFKVIQDNIKQILPDIGGITINNSLKELGANSIDRAEIIINTMQDLGIKVNLVEFGDCRNIRDIIEVLDSKKGKSNV